MRKNLWIKTTGIFLAGTMLCTMFAGCQKKSVTENPILKAELENEEYVQQAYTNKAKKVKKEETVYINARPDGSVYKVNVTDWIHTNEPQVRVEDSSNLSAIHNVKTLTEPIQGDGTIYWDMDATDLYYSGVSNEEPPVSFDIQYFLDGQEMSAEEIAGQKGSVSIKITLENSLKKKVKIDKKTYEITCPMLVVGGTIFPESSFSNIAIDNGTAISDGAKQIVFFAGIPGIDDSLGISELDLSILEPSMYTNTYTITAYTDCFELGNMLFAVMPFSAIGSLGNGGLTDGIDGLKNILTDVEALQKALKGLDLQKIIDLLYGDSQKIETLLNTVQEAAELYTENEKMLKVLGSYMTPENIKKLDKLVDDLEKTDVDAIANTLSDPKVQQLLKLLPKLSKSLSEISVLAEDLNDVMPIFQSLAKDMEDPEIQRSLENLPQTLEKLNKMIKALEENKTLIESIGTLVSDDNIDSIETIVDTAGDYKDFESLSSEQINALAGRVKAWLDFGSTYHIFTKTAEGMDSTVMFTYKTDAIKPSSTPIDAPVEEVKEDNKFVAWLKKIF